jgi:hypothetical protein
MKRIYTFLFVFFLLTGSLFAREGMWIPTLLNKNINEMQQMGFQLSFEDIYSINQSSMKDAIVFFGRGCTGELISPEGLMITNHHCGFGQIQQHSSLENDYLTDGFWAMNRDEELMNEGLSVTFLVEMRDVTEQVLEGTCMLESEEDVQDLIRANISQIISNAIEDTHYNAEIKPIFHGNQYYLYLTEKFTDVRLVGAPPSAIGKFGGDTDNWMWPRHTGDFALFRIYANKDNKPADYSPDNVPYKPRHYFPINIRGVNEGDFTMVFGYPGSTQQYLYSDAVRLLLEMEYPNGIAIRDVKLDIMRSAMEADRKTRIQYAAKYASTSNAWKKWDGEIRGLRRLDAVNVKIEEEKEFAQWVAQNEERKEKYGGILSAFDSLYKQIEPYQQAKLYFEEIIMRGTDAYRIYSFYGRRLSDNTGFDTDDIERFNENHFKDYRFDLDRDVFVALLQKLHADIDERFLPDVLLNLMSKRNPIEALDKIYSNSILAHAAVLEKTLRGASRDKLEKQLERDDLYRFFDDLIDAYYQNLMPSYRELSGLIDKTQKKYMAALLEMHSGEMLYPDANLTLRVSYGQVEGYEPANGVYYRHYTTLEGIMQKDNPEIYDYNVPERLRELYAEGNYGKYAKENGEMPVCFIASNHTTGGNSGSPVINAQGHLIGMNFDRCWEGTMSDIMFDPDKCRNISVDMRYMLFLIDKFAGAGYLIDEMEIIN